MTWMVEGHGAIHNTQCCTAETYIRVRIQEIHLLCQAFRKGDIVAIHARDILALCQIDPFIKRINQLLIRFVAFQPDPVILVGLNNLDAIICRTVINDKKFKIREGLIQYTLDGLVQIVPPVIHGH
jgi:hypothetical protein